MEKLAKNKTAPGRYALLDELRGLDLVSMMLYHACWDLVFLFGVQMNWYAATPGHLWQQSICLVFILLSGFCVPLGHHTLRRGATVFGAGVLVTAVTLLFMPEDRVVFGVLTLLGSAMLLTGLLEPLLKKEGTARCRSRRGGGAVRADLSCGGPLPRHRCAAAGPAGKSVCQLLHGLSGFLPVVVLFYRLFPAGAVAVFVLVRLFPARGRGPHTHGTAAPFGLRPAWLDGAAFAGAVSAASAGHLWGALGHLPNFSLKRLDTARQLWYPIGG